MAPDAPPPVSLAVPPLVGRAPELAAIAAVLAAAEGRGVLISGPIGVGKTRLATEIMGRRAASGAVVLRVIATSATADIPLGALAAVTHLGVRAGDRREAVVERVVGDLAAAADGAPLLLVVDDVDLLDPRSHQVVRALVERRVARVLGTARTPGPPLPPPWTTPGVVDARGGRGGRPAGATGPGRTAGERVTAARCEGGAGRTDRAGAAPAGRGPRQREVVLLAVKGLSHQEVAERLGIPTRTVENHLHRAYAELGVDGRRGLAAVVDG